MGLKNVGILTGEGSSVLVCDSLTGIYTCVSEELAGSTFSVKDVHFLRILNFRTLKIEAGSAYETSFTATDTASHPRKVEFSSAPPVLTDGEDIPDSFNDF